MSNFDGLQKTAFSTVENLYGDLAVWSPSSLPEVSGLVLFKSPNDLLSTGDTDKYEYRPYNYSFEYFKDQFVGLKASVDSGNLENVSCKGFDLVVREVYSKFDGNTYTAYCELKVVEE